MRERKENTREESNRLLQEINTANSRFRFRSWHKNVYVPGSNEGMRYSSEFKSLSKFFEDARDNTGCMIMQSTGIKDGNGVEIYEGDILGRHRVFLGKEWDEYHEVVYRNGEFVGQDSRDIKGCIITASLLVTIPFSVKGNIYENPELLKQDIYYIRKHSNLNGTTTSIPGPAQVETSNHSV